MFVFKKNHYLFVFAVLVVTVSFVAWRNSESNTSVPSIEAESPSIEAVHFYEMNTDSEKNECFIGVWIPYLSLISDYSEEGFKQNFMDKLCAAAEIHATAIFVHVRPFGDSLYPSEYEPWSHILTGTQGEDPGFDPLAYMLEQTHALGMEFHAWVNPLRISTGLTPGKLSGENFYEKNKELNPHFFMEYKDVVYYNPASAEIRERIADAAAEIAEKYAVDGIHFDDYFYPTDDASLDAISYEAYKDSSENPLTLLEWRKANINSLISSVYQKIKRKNTNVIFGISPQGNIENDLKMGADVYTWCAQKGYLDYICPQLYYPLDSESLQFEEALIEWRSIMENTGAKMYTGLAVYKLGSDMDSGAWKEDEVIEKQIALCFSYDISGISFYAVDTLQENDMREIIRLNVERFVSER